MPDVIEMPYTPPLYMATPKEADNNHLTNPYPYRLGGPTCLSGDIIGDYYFNEPLKIGDMLIFGDMAIYSTCKNNTFNGMALPNIYKMTVMVLLKSLRISGTKILKCDLEDNYFSL